MYFRHLPMAVLLALLIAALPAMLWGPAGTLVFAIALFGVWSEMGRRLP